MQWCGVPANASPCAQVVTDEMWAARAARWPDQPPATREYFLLRSIFEEHFPSPSALATVPTVRAWLLVDTRVFLARV